MSMNLFWRPNVPAKDHSLADALKYILRKSMATNEGPTVINASDRRYFEGLRDAGIEGAKEVLEALEKYQTIELYER